MPYSYSTFVVAIDVEGVEDVSLQGFYDGLEGGNKKFDFLVNDEGVDDY